MLAVRNGNVEMVKDLLEHGVDVHAVNNAGETALTIAAGLRHDGIIRLLNDAVSNGM